jgi:hypothetical protein
MALIEEPLTRNNAANQIGQIESSLHLPKQEMDKRPPAKNTALLGVDLHEKQLYSEIMTYDKLREFASEYVKGKKN